MDKSKVKLVIYPKNWYLIEMIQRTITKEFIAAAQEFPVVTVVGPRQSGKTTLARMTYPQKAYCSLEDPDVRKIAQLDPRGFLNRFPDGAILDEIQRVPELLSYIQGIVDTKNIPGYFILTGSHQPLLQQAISQSLAGRTAMLTLLPFSFKEIQEFGVETDVFRLILTGGFPRIYEQKVSTDRFFNSYLQTYIERDLRLMANIKDLSLFEKFLTLLAGRIGQIVNYNSLSNDTGISATTIKNWISLLKASYIVFELQSWTSNIGKRVIKSPKIYFTDTGLVSFLLGIRDTTQLFRDPLRGGLYENFIILDILKSYQNAGKRADLYFYRDRHGNEVDLLLRNGSLLTPIEIKSAETFNESFLDGVEKFCELVGQKNCTNGIVLYNGTQQADIRGISVLNPLLHKTDIPYFVM
jgi:predicted AAA+ superfamily ATPase